MKKIICLLMSIIMLFGIAACGVNVPEQPVNIVDSTVTAKIAVSILMDAGEKKMFDEAIVEYNKIYPNVTVEIKQINNYESSLIGEIQAGAKLDVLHMSENYVSYFAAENVLENLEPYIASKGFRQADGFDRSLYYESMIKLGKLNFDEAQYMMPRDYSKIVTYWNENMFDEYGITKRPSNDWTWNDFIDICADLKAKIPSNFMPLDASMEYAILNHAVLASNGVDKYLNDDFLLKDDATFKSNLLNGMEMSANLIKSGYSAKPDNFTPNDFFRKQAPMAFGVRAAFTNYANPSQGINFKVAPFPRIGEPATAKIPAGASGFGIYKNSRNKNAAWSFINFIMSYEGQKAISGAGGTVPVLKKLAEEETSDWRKLKNGVGNDVDHNVFIDKSERDVVPDFYGNIPGKSIPMYRNSWSGFLKDYFNEKKEFDVAFSDLKKSISRIKRDYPEYFA